MAKYCCKECKETGGACDFCIYFEFKKGYCKLTNEETMEGNTCKKFHCVYIK